MDEATFEGGQDQRRDWVKLMDAINEAEFAPPCENFPDAYHSEDTSGSEQRLALAGCAVCPVLNDCALYGLKWETQGIWGGMTASKRRALRAKTVAA